MEVDDELPSSDSGTKKNKKEKRKQKKSVGEEAQPLRRSRKLCRFGVILKKSVFLIYEKS